MSSVNSDVYTSLPFLKNDVLQSIWSSCPIPFMETHLPDEELVSTRITSLACVNGGPTVAAGQVNCSLNCSSQRASRHFWEWIRANEFTNHCAYTRIPRTRIQNQSVEVATISDSRSFFISLHLLLPSLPPISQTPVKLVPPGSMGLVVFCTGGRDLPASNSVTEAEDTHLIWSLFSK